MKEVLIFDYATSISFEQHAFIGGANTHKANQWQCLGFLTHWGRVTHICVSKLTIIGSDNGLSPGRRQAIIRTNAGILLIRPLGTNFSENLIGILTPSFKKMRLKVSSAKWRPLYLGLNVLIDGLIFIYYSILVDDCQPCFKSSSCGRCKPFCFFTTIYLSKHCHAVRYRCSILVHIVWGNYRKSLGWVHLFKTKRALLSHISFLYLK